MKFVNIIDEDYIHIRVTVLKKNKLHIFQKHFTFTFSLNERTKIEMDIKNINYLKKII